MSELKQPTDLNNTPNVTETVPSDAPMKKIHKRGCPSTSKGVVREWWWIRITAALLVPLSVWFVVSLITHLLGAEPIAVAAWLLNPFVAGAVVLLLLAGFIHNRLGIHEIVTDYVHAPAKKRATNLLVDLLSLGLGVASIAAVIHLHLMA